MSKRVMWFWIAVILLTFVTALVLIDRRDQLRHPGPKPTVTSK